MEWSYSSQLTFRNWAYLGSTRSITGKIYADSLYVGEYLEGYGRTTGWETGWIKAWKYDGYNMGIKPTSGGGPVQGGDSGGPWVLIYSAAGITKSRCQFADLTWGSCFVTVDVIEYLGVGVMTAP